MKAESHLKSFEEHKRNIFVWALEINGVENSQKTVGLNASRGIVELLAAFLEEENKVSPGFHLNHRWFKSGKIYSKLPEFPKKKTVVEKMTSLENLSETLTYGSPKPVEQIKKAVFLFKELEDVINGLRGKKNEQT